MPEMPKCNVQDLEDAKNAELFHLVRNSEDPKLDKIREVADEYNIEMRFVRKNRCHEFMDMNWCYMVDPDDKLPYCTGEGDQCAWLLGRFVPIEEPYEEPVKEEPATEGTEDEADCDSEPEQV